MKLYTEEQLRRAIKKSYEPKNKNGNALEYWFTNDEVINSLTPIELPSEEKIEKEAVYFSDSLSIYDTAKDDTLYGFREGAKWVIEQIKKHI